ncbi:hypothetical protein BGC07_00200 [Piscirickettsia litoralis]|uniref:DUF4440 domain-containing protein n=1 Tax=Piscirickettsia litoralis TaxID=1891921 RepID=A0ABX3A523_9GAMM|nr:hypothetical protein BGC07_00200 [Piscirickettsia litoralis]
MEKLIKEKELALLTAEVCRSKDKLRSLLSSDFLEVGASGAYFGLNEVLEKLPAENSWQAHAQDFEFRSLAEGVVQLIFRAVIRANSESAGVYSRRTSIWRNEVCGWRMVYHQGTKTVPFDLIM